MDWGNILPHFAIGSLCHDWVCAFFQAFWALVMKNVNILTLKLLVKVILLNKSRGSKSRGIVFIILLCVKPAAGLWGSILFLASRLVTRKF